MLKTFLHSINTVIAILLLTISFSDISYGKNATIDHSDSKVPTAINLNKQININKDWQFKRISPREKKTNWQNIDLPHTPKVEPLLVNNQWQGTALYQKNLVLDAKWQNQRIFIRFEGAMNHAQVWLNNKKVAEHLGGYLPFTVDITEQVYFGKSNLLQVTLTNTDNTTIGPKPLHRLDFNSYGGLYRDVSLLIKAPLHITDEMHANKKASGGVFVSYPKINPARSVVEVKTHIVNQYQQSKDFVLKQSIFFDGKLVASVEDKIINFSSGGDKQFTQQLVVNNAQLWSPTSPHLYQLVSDIYLNDNLLDTKKTRIGLRTFEFNDKHQLLINGEVTYLRGVNRHQEYPHVGYATSAYADYRDAVKIKSAGFDYVRLSHYPHSKAFMDAADELGLVLLDAVLGWQFYADTPDFQAQILQTCRDLIRRDRNHASVLAWECSLNETWMPKDYVQQLIDVVKQEDLSRLSAGWLPEYDIFLQARQHRKKHKKIPNKPYNVSEYGDWEYYAQNAGLNQHAWADLKKEARTSRQLLSAGETRLLQQARNLQQAHNDNFTTPAFADSYWVMFDYNRGVADNLESSGVMSIHRLPKYSYYFYQSQRDAEEVSPWYQSGPMVFIASEWQENSATNIRVFSNTDEVELWLDNQLISRNKPSTDTYSSHLAHAPFEFDLKRFQAGQLTAKAYIKGKLVAQHQVTTPGAAKTLHLTLDESGKAPVTGVKDVVFVYAQLLDAQGNNVPLNGVEVEFSATGDIEIVQRSSALTSQGKAAILLRIGDSLAGANISAQVIDLAITSKALALLP